MDEQKRFLVFGATGRTGQHLVRLALGEGHAVRAVARTPAKLSLAHPDLEVRQGTVPDVPDLDALLHGVDFVIALLGDVELQRERRINTEFVEQLVPAMRRSGVTRFLYQAGALSAPPTGPLPPRLRLIRNTLGRAYDGQHLDNEAVMEHLANEAPDIEWMVHRAGIGSDRPGRGVLHRSATRFSIATFEDCAAYALRTVMDRSAVHTCDLSSYRAGRG